MLAVLLRRISNGVKPGALDDVVVFVVSELL